MLQYILNLSAIWLISLVVFDVFLRRESFHSYNRFYLLLTFAAGLLLPLYQYGHHTLVAAVAQPAQQVFAAKQFVQETATRITAESSTDWLRLIWISGMLVTTGIMSIDIIRLITFYTGGKRSAQGKWTIVETHKEHAPFSLWNILFISSRRLYNADEWNMLLLHERQHARLVHFADVTLLQLCRIVLWFHPLVHIYHNRLLLVHEYQADGASRHTPQAYSRFLVEQMMLQSAPSVAHALSNAPVKNRIQMLTHTSRSYRQPAKLLVLPLIALYVVCFTRYDIEYKAASYTGHSIPSNPAPGNPIASTLTPYTYSYDNYGEDQQYKQAVKTKNGKAITQTMVYAPSRNTGMRYNDAIIQLGGMENNANANCCSSNLLWGRNYGGVAPAICYPDKQPAFVVEYAGNACTPALDRYRKDQYMHAVETYRKIQESWSEYSGDNSTALVGLSGKTTQIIIADDPWNQHTDLSPGMVPPLSLDRSVFGPNTKTIYDDAMAIAARKEAPAIGARDLLGINSYDARPAAKAIKNGISTAKINAFTP